MLPALSVAVITTRYSFYADFVDGQCELKDNGVYSIRTEDVAGNVKTYNLTDLFNNLHNNVVVDLENPVISATVNDQPIADVWLTEDSRLGFKVTDNEALQSVIVSINGVNYPYQIEDGSDILTDYIDPIPSSTTTPLFKTSIDAMPEPISEHPASITVRLPCTYRYPSSSWV